eukprot:s883_g6.t1
MFLGDRIDSGKDVPYFKMTRAGPRETLHFDPHDPASAAAIVSCGGICPGLNCVIREIVNMLWSYGVRKIYGIKGGYKGVMEPEKWLELTPELVKERGERRHGQDVAEQKRAAVLCPRHLSFDPIAAAPDQVATLLPETEIDHECAVVGVPKTIDNDVPMIDQTFGFDTACTEATKAVNSAYVEAKGNANCIGLVKLMGRHCGFIAMNAALAARDVDICLIPEMNIDLEKVLKHVEHLMRTKGHCVMVVAEGCGDTLIQSSGEKDAGGNKILADVGPWLKDTITARFKTLGLPLTIKYIDPTYMIRSVPANSYDSTYCSVLGQMAVHGAMAGYSGITVGQIYSRYCYLPIHAITNQKGKRVNPKGRWFFRMQEATKQPNFTPDVPSSVVQAAGPNAGDVLEAGGGFGRMAGLWCLLQQPCPMDLVVQALVMDFRSWEVCLAWVVALLVGCLHYAEVSGYSCVHNGLTVSEQKDVFLKTENAFYFSYYDDFVTAETLSEAVWRMLRDARSEAPDVINAIHRSLDECCQGAMWGFNIYQEVICGFLYRLIPKEIAVEDIHIWRRDWIDPWYFFRGCSYVLQGLGHVALLRLAAAVGGDGLWGGVLPGVTLAMLLFLHRLDFSRIHDVGMLELRENWTMPVIFAQVWAMTKLLLTHPAFSGQSSWEFLGWRWAFRICTVLCILLWQFSAFAFLLQVSAAFLCTLLACHNSARAAMMELLNSQLLAVLVVAGLLFGNELLVQHLLVTQLVAIKLVLSLRKAPTWRLLWWLDGALAVLLFLLLRILQMPFATADEHVWELYAHLDRAAR